jgi:hypothetical protein
VRTTAAVALVCSVSLALSATGQTALYRGYTLSVAKVSKKSKITLPSGAGYDLVPRTRDEEFLEIEVAFTDPGGADLEWAQKDSGSGMTLAKMPARDILLSPPAILIGLDGKPYRKDEQHNLRFDNNKKKGRLGLLFTVPKGFAPSALRIGDVELSLK